MSHPSRILAVLTARGWGNSHLLAVAAIMPQDRALRYRLVAAGGRAMVCSGRKDRAASEARLRPLLWHGDVDAARQFLETLRAQARHEEKLDELLGYLAKHRAAIPNYDQRRANCQFNGAGQVEKENDLLVARRQKRRGMQWVEQGADVICALRTVWFNGQWDTYWNTGLTLPFALAA